MEAITGASSKQMAHGRRHKRKMMKMDASVWSWLPEQLFVPILSQLPLSSLFELRSVCKRWNSILSDPRFLKTCLRAAAEQAQSKFKVTPAITSSSPSSSASSSPSSSVAAMDISTLDRAHREARRRHHYHSMKFSKSSSSSSSYRLYMSLAKTYYRRCFREWAQRLTLILTNR